MPLFETQVPEQTHMVFSAKFPVKNVVSVFGDLRRYSLSLPGFFCLLPIDLSRLERALLIY